MRTEAQIIEDLGGTRPVAAALSLPVSTVQSWKVRKGFPPGYWQALVDLADRLDKNLSLQELASLARSREEEARAVRAGRKPEAA